jgi:hypothetical protein
VLDESLINIVGNDGDLEGVEIKDFNPNKGVCVLEGQTKVANDLESDNTHTIPRTKRRDYKQKWQQQAIFHVAKIQAQENVLSAQEEVRSLT